MKMNFKGVVIAALLISLDCALSLQAEEIHKKDVVGTWRCYSEFDDGQVTVTLNEDGTAVHVKKYTGTWTVKGNKLIIA
ncbi:MAG: glycoside hydrolase family 43 C-terminal domain-containing protein [Victivallales bacterium]